MAEPVEIQRKIKQKDPEKEKAKEEAKKKHKDIVVEVDEKEITEVDESR